MKLTEREKAALLNLFYPEGMPYYKRFGDYEYQQMAHSFYGGLLILKMRLRDLWNEIKRGLLK